MLAEGTVRGYGLMSSDFTNEPTNCKTTCPSCCPRLKSGVHFELLEKPMETRR